VSADQRLSELHSRIAQVREREEARLIKTARAAGYFDRLITTPNLRAGLDEFLSKAGPRQSQLARLEQELKMAKVKQTAQERKDDARRKILLGSFLIAQFEHKPALLAQLQSELDKFLDQHKDKHVADANKALLGQWLGQNDAKSE